MDYREVKMLGLLSTLKVAGPMTAIAIGGGILFSFVGTFADSINESTPVAIGLVGSAMLVVWYMSKTLADLKNTDRTNTEELKAIRKSIRRIQQHMGLQELIDDDETTKK